MTAIKKKLIQWTKAEWDAFWAWLKEPEQGGTEKNEYPWYCDADWEEPTNVPPDFVMTEADYYGEMRWQGDGQAISRNDLFDGIDLVVAIWKWKRSRQVATITIEIDKSKLDALKSAIAAMGGKVLK